MTSQVMKIDNNVHDCWFGRIQFNPLLEYEFSKIYPQNVFFSNFFKQLSSEFKVINCPHFAYGFQCVPYITQCDIKCHPDAFGDRDRHKCYNVIGDFAPPMKIENISWTEYPIKEKDTDK